MKDVLAIHLSHSHPPSWKPATVQKAKVLKHTGLW